MTTENIIYKPLRDTQDNLIIRLEPGEFGFSTDTDSMVFKSADGINTEVFRNPANPIIKIRSGSGFPPTANEEGDVFILDTNENSGLYRFTKTSAEGVVPETFDWIIDSPLAGVDGTNGRLLSTDKIKIDNIVSTATDVTNGLVPVITNTSGGKLSDADAVTFAALSQPEQSDFAQNNNTEISFIKNKPTTITTTQTNDITNARIKLSGIEDNAQENVVKSVSNGNGLSLINGVLNISQINLSDVETFSNTTIRNASSSTRWHRGDVAIITDSNENYIYTGADQTNPNVTTNADWTQLALPNNAVTSVQGLSGPVVILPEATTSISGLASTAQITTLNANTSKLSGIDTGAQINIKSDWNETNTSADSYIQNKPQTIEDLLPVNNLPADAPNGQTVLLNTTRNYTNTPLGSHSIGPGVRFFNENVVEATYGMVKTQFQSVFSVRHFAFTGAVIPGISTGGLGLLRTTVDTDTATQLEFGHNRGIATYTVDGGSNQLLQIQTDTTAAPGAAQSWAVAFNAISTIPFDATAFTPAGAATASFLAYRTGTAIALGNGVVHVRTGIWNVNNASNPTAFTNEDIALKGLTNFGLGFENGVWTSVVTNGTAEINNSDWY